MTSNGALAEYDQAACKDVRALNGDGDRSRNEPPAEVIFRPQHNALAAVHVHCVVGNLASEFRAVVLENCGRDGRFFALIYGSRRYCYGSIHNVGMTGDSGERLTHSLKVSDRCIELLADRRVRSSRIACGLATAGCY